MKREREGKRNKLRDKCMRYRLPSQVSAFPSAPVEIHLRRRRRDPSSDASNKHDKR